MANLNTLIDFRYRQHIKARRGGGGMGKDRTGAGSPAVTLKLPVGTQIFGEDNETLIADLTATGQRVVLAHGGRGGFGNAHFKSSTNRAPRRTEPGAPGEERWLWLRLKLIADAGLVGLPNAGKSTFLAAVSQARPKIADYPFTTLNPQLGVAQVDDRELVLADIPGLIEGANEGHGLGDRFLGHIERCRVLLHLVDGTLDDVAAAYRTVREEMAAYGHGLCDKPEIVALNKSDAFSADALADKRAALEEAASGAVLALSGATGAGVQATLRALLTEVGKPDRDQQAAPAAEAAWQP